VPDDEDAARDLWQQAHSATLGDYGLTLDSDTFLYHPDTQSFLGLEL
jgi:hypothetical protein